jgi:hypothetical protein
MTIINQHTVTNLPANTDFRIYAGDTVNQTIYIKDSEGVPVVLAGASFLMLLKDNRGNELFTFTENDGIEIVDDGEILITITDTQTAEMPINCGLPYSLQWTTSEGIKKTILAGFFHVTNNMP